MSEFSLFVDVIVPLNIPGLLTYSVPESLANVQTGCRVMVQLGKRKLYTAIVFSIHNEKPKFPTKDILSILDETPIILESQFELWSWMSEYYMCSPGDVYKAALPSGLKIESDSIAIPVNYEFDEIELTEKEKIILQIVNDNPAITIQKLREVAQKEQAVSSIKSLIEKKVIALEENLTEKYSPKYEKYISLHPDIDNEDKVNLVFSKLANAAKQSDVLLAFFSLCQPFQPLGKTSTAKSLLSKKVSDAGVAIKALIKKGILLETEIEVGRLQVTDEKTRELHPLNNYQEIAINEIKNHFTNKNVVLLHGVTSSGKTEIYIQLIHETIKRGGMVLYLLPEIALTSQIINRLRSVFGKRVGIYHSKFSDSERVETYLNVLKGTEYDVILGVRSAIFLPFNNLELIIVDEEHENTYKQFDPSPRYHCRDTSLVLARTFSAKVLLGTATPSMESFFHAKQQNFGLVTLSQRFNDILLPEIKIVDTKQASERKQMRGHFSDELINEIEKTLNEKEQVILFQNRRGYSPYIECDICGYKPQCTQCDVNLTYHKHSNQLVCHYCGYAISMPVYCDACGSNNLQTRGFGTEKLEDDLSLLLPNAKLARMDTDTARNKKSAEKIIYDFSVGNTDILIGTQMLSKGLDFDNVGLVGIINADNLLNFPDFRSFERSFQLMAQVSGRAGRRNKQGRVIIQTRQPDHEILQKVIQNDYQGFYDTEMANRNLFFYPPFTRIINIDIKHVQSPLANKASEILAQQLRLTFKHRILGPEAPLISRIQNLYIKRISLKVERDLSVKNVRMAIYNAIDSVRKVEGLKSVIINIDVDPQ